MRWEREQRGMTYEGLAARMTAAGCSIQPSALYKIEKSNPPRRITVDELVALAAVFDLEIADLLTPVEVAFHKELRAVAEAENAAFDALHSAAQEALRAREAHLALYRRAHEEEDEALLSAIQAWEAEFSSRMRPSDGPRMTLREAIAMVEAQEAEKPEWQRRQERRLDDAFSELTDAIMDVADERARGES
jgi:transcriptional regulator with XRE-family HTH domain